MAIHVTAAQGVGAYVNDIDLRQIDEDAIAHLRDALGEYGVLFFREQSLSPQDHINLAEAFGKININRFFTAVDGYPNIAEVLKEPDQAHNVGSKWHTDHSYDEAPALGSILVARELPSHGGDTIFRNLAAAYESLPDSLKERIAPLNALHSSRHVFGASAYSDNDLQGRLGNTDLAKQDVIHPMVIRHPISGKSVLYVNPGFTVGIDEMERAAGNELLEQLYAHVMQPQFEHRFSWKKGSVVFWDNRATWHSALNDYPGERRLMHRITVEGCTLQPAASA